MRTAVGKDGESTNRIGPYEVAVIISDRIQSLGCVLYAMCAGTSPFKADTTIATIRRLCDETPQPLTEVNATIPQGLSDLITRLLAKNPEQRYQSAQDVVDDLIQQLRSSNRTAADHGVSSPAGERRGDRGSVQADRPPIQPQQHTALRRSRYVALGCLVLVAVVAISELSGVTGFLVLDESDTTEAISTDNERPPKLTVNQDALFFDRLISDRYRWSEPINLGPPISTIYDESYPRLTADGLLLVFSSTRPYPEGQNNRGDIWIAERPTLDSPFGQPVNQGPAINTERVEGQPSLSGDGLILVFSRQRLDGSGYDLWIAERASRESPWSQAEKLGGGFVGEHQYNNCANLSTDGLTLDFTSMALGGRPIIPRRSTRQSTADPWPDPIDISLTAAPLTHNFRSFNFASGNRLAVMLSIPDEGRTLFVRETHDSPWARLEVTDEDLRPEGTVVGNAFERYIFVDGSTIIYDASWDTGLGERDIWMARRVDRLPD